MTGRTQPFQAGPPKRGRPAYSVGKAVERIHRRLEVVQGRFRCPVGIALSGLTPLFEEIMSVESTRRFKPHPAPYLMAAQRLGEDPADLWMVAVHDWDVAAAMKVGFRGAFLARPGHIVTSCVEEPDLICSNLEELAEALIDRA